MNLLEAILEQMSSLTLVRGGVEVKLTFAT